jgi:hypothetical protein
LILTGVIGSTVAQAALPKTAADMEAAHGKEAIAIREAIISTLPSDVSLRDKLANDEIIPTFRSCLTSTNPDARLNTAMMMCQLQTLSADAVLMDMLKNPDASVRYWGAKGLAGIVQSMKLVGAQAVVKALDNAAKGEKSGVVLQEIVKALALYEDLGGILDALDAVGTLMKGSISDKGIIDAATVALHAVDKSIKTAAPAAKVAALVASLAAQQQLLSFNAQQAIGQALDKAYTSSVTSLLEAALKVLNDASGKTFSLHGETDVAGQQLIIKGITGEGATPGDIQKAMPDVPIPPTIKSGN